MILKKQKKGVVDMRWCYLQIAEKLKSVYLPNV